jgi:hypothetical protein
MATANLFLAQGHRWPSSQIGTGTWFSCREECIPTAVYRELRDQYGVVQPNVKAQSSFHIVLSNDFSFKMWERPFKMVTEAYYKSMTDVNPYTLENVRIRYAANNTAEAFAQGLDLRLNGEFVKGTESWLSLATSKQKRT